MLREIVAAGVTVVRFWLLADGISLVRSDAAELPEGFVDDVRGLLDTLHVHGLRAIPSLTSFELFFPELRTKDGSGSEASPSSSSAIRSGATSLRSSGSSMRRSRRSSGSRGPRERGSIPPCSRGR